VQSTIRPYNRDAYLPAALCFHPDSFFVAPSFLPAGAGGVELSGVPSGIGVRLDEAAADVDWSIEDHEVGLSPGILGVNCVVERFLGA
jgi:hypothetical protein